MDTKRSKIYEGTEHVEKYIKNVKMIENLQNKKNCILRTAEEGVIEVHIIRLQLSRNAIEILFEEGDLCNTYVNITWNFYGEKPITSPTATYPNLNYNSSSIYHIYDLNKFFNLISNKYIIFQVKVQQNRKEYCLAVAKLYVHDILDYPQNKLSYIIPLYSIMPRNKCANLGQLYIWLHLSCELDKVQAFKKEKGLYVLEYTDKDLQWDYNHHEKGNESILNLDNLNNENTIVTLDYSKNNIFQQSALNKIYEDIPKEKLDKMITSRNSEDNLKQSMILNSLADKENNSIETLSIEKSMNILEASTDEDTSNSDEVIQHEKNDKVTLRSDVDTVETHDVASQIESLSLKEFNEVLANNYTNYESDSSIRDVHNALNDNNWERYKNISSQNKFPKEKLKKSLEKTNKESDLFVQNNIITITIVSLTLFHSQALLLQAHHKNLFVDYSFLGHHGIEMETESQPIPTEANAKIIYNFYKEFHIDRKHHSHERKMLNAMLTGKMNPNIKFIIVTEPLKEEINTKECEEVGCAFFNIKEFQSKSNNTKDITLMVTDSYQTKNIGLLKIVVTGLESMRQCSY